MKTYSIEGSVVDFAGSSRDYDRPTRSQRKVITPEVAKEMITPKQRKAMTHEAVKELKTERLRRKQLLEEFKNFKKHR